MKSAYHFFLRVVAISILGIVAIGFINYKINLFGLFGDVKGQSVSIHGSERMSKYLLSYNYVPTNFDGILLGPSLSANINTKLNQDGKVYNCSMLGANITEVASLFNNVIENGELKNVYICLHPYLLKDHGFKTSSISSKTYLSALGSFGLFKVYGIGLLRKYNLWPSKYPANQYNDYGFNYYNESFSNIPVEDKIAEELLKDKEVISIDAVALTELKEVIEKCDEKGVNVTAYFHPLPDKIQEYNQVGYGNFREEVRKVFDQNHLVIDYNKNLLGDFTSDYTNYIDHGHLSLKGQETLFSDLVARSKSFFLINSSDQIKTN
jgi:hypothetical protein